MREDRVDSERQDRVARLAELLDDADAVDHDVGSYSRDCAHGGVGLQRVDAAHETLLRDVRVHGELSPETTWVDERRVHFEPRLEDLEHLVAQHAVATEDEDSHDSASSLARVSGSAATHAMYSVRPRPSIGTDGA